MSEHASTAKAAFGFVFYRSGAEVKNCRKQGLPNVDNDEEETTHHGSPGRKKEFLQTLGENVPFDVEIDFDKDDAVHKALYLDCCNLVTGGTYGLDFPDLDISISGTGYIRNWKWGDMTPGGIQRATFTFRESPAWDWDVEMA